MDFGFATSAPTADKAGPPAATPSTPAGLPASAGESKYTNAARNYEQFELQPVTGADVDSVMTLIVYGSKDAGKSIGPAGIKTRQGGRKVIISCDNTTEESLRNYYGPTFLQTPSNPKGECILYEPARRRVKSERNPDGTIKRGPDGKPMVTELYPGYDPKRPWTAELVLSKIAKIMAELRAAGDVEVFVLDHYQHLYEGIAATYARYKAGREPEQRMQLEDWNFRTDAMNYIEAESRDLPMPGGVAIITGYGPEEKTFYGDEITLPNGKKKRPVKTEVVPPKWLNPKTVRNWHVILDMSYVDVKDNVPGAQRGVAQYFCDVVASKTPRFPKGAKVDITNDSLELFWSARHKIPPVEDPLTVAA